MDINDNTISIKDLFTPKSIILSDFQDQHFNATVGINNNNVMTLNVNSGPLLKNVLKAENDLSKYLTKQNEICEAVKLTLSDSGDLMVTAEYPIPIDNDKKLFILLELEKTAVSTLLALLTTKKTHVQKNQESNCRENANHIIEENLAVFKPVQSKNGWKIHIQGQDNFNQKINLIQNEKHNRLVMQAMFCELQVTNRKCLNAILLYLLHTMVRCRFCRIKLTDLQKGVVNIGLEIILYWDLIKTFTPEMAVRAIMAATAICKPVVSALKNEDLANQYLIHGLNRYLLKTKP